MPQSQEPEFSAANNLISHSWRKKSKTPVSVEIAVLVIVDLLLISIFSLMLSGHQQVWGIKLGKPDFRTVFDIIAIVGLSYYWLGKTINRTTIEVANQTLYIYITPLPWPARQSIPLAMIKQLRIKEEVRKFGRRMLSQEFSVHAQLQNGADVPIIDGIASKVQAGEYLNRIQQAVDKQL